MLMPSRVFAAEQFLETATAHYVTELKSLEQALGLQEFAGHDSGYQRLKQATDSVCESCWDIEKTIGDDKELLDQTRKNFRNRIAPWFHKSPLFFHAITKPRGYAGDYQMLIAIYENKVRSTGIGGYLDHYFLNTELARAVVARMKAVRNYLNTEIQRRNKDLSILDVACGPCHEYIQGINIPNGRKIQVSLLDYDRGALDYVEKRVIAQHYDGSHFRCIRFNALRMRSADRFIQQYGKHDIIYSVGLCDYIADKQLIPMLNGWRQSANDGGIVYVAFKDAKRYTTPIYQWVTDWHFLQRTQEDCVRIMKNAGFDVEQMKMTRDETGIIMNFMAPVTTSRMQRLDQAHQQVALPPESLNGRLSQPGGGESATMEVNQ